MTKYEKKSFIKIFLGYFISVAIFVLILGYLYFKQHQTIILQNTAMQMHQYILKLKQSNFNYSKIGYSYEIVDFIKVKKTLPMRDKDVFYKAFTNNLVIKVDANIVDRQIAKLKTYVIVAQILLLLFFALVSYLLTKRSLQPMIEAFNHLDNFTKDLIHDLNTPVTSILLNTKMLKKQADETTIKKINRIESSAKNISSLYANLEILLNGNKLSKKDFDLSIIIEDLISEYKIIYPNIDFIFEKKIIKVNSNNIAIKRILDNIISNACKYSRVNSPFINIEFKNNTLYIKDNGKGIKYPKKIFQRNYKEDDNGYGIGMHIVYKLCSELNHTIEIESVQYKGTQVSISF
jgi:two-component system OmpR family sensor kinase